MGRPRQRDKHLPPCVYYIHGSHWFRRSGASVNLGPDLSRALAEYGRLVRAPRGGMAALIDEALAASASRLSQNTRSQYRTAARHLKQRLVEFSPEQVTMRHVVEVREDMRNTPGMANRCLSLLRTVFDYALERQIIDSNPAVGVRRLEERKRERLITPDEYERIYVAAGPRLQVIMDLCAMTGQRIGDVLTIRYADLREDGIAVRQDKTGARLVIGWTPELRAVVERAKTLHGNVRALTLLHNRRGKPPDYRTVKLQWDVACKAAGVPDAHLHDLRAMAATAAQAQGLDAQALLGHTSAANTRRYLRSKAVPIVAGPSLKRGAK